MAKNPTVSDELAKKFSTEDSGKFVNGILDNIKGELMRPARLVK